MGDERQTDVDIRPWTDGDFPLLERLMSDPAMTDHLGGPETLEKIRERHERYSRISGLDALATRAALREEMSAAAERPRAEPETHDHG